MSHSERRSSSTTSLSTLSASSSALDVSSSMPRPLSTAPPGSPLLESLDLESRRRRRERAKARSTRNGETGNSEGNAKNNRAPKDSNGHQTSEQTRQSDDNTDADDDDDAIWKEHCIGCTEEQLQEVESFQLWLNSDAAPRSQWVGRDRFVAIKFLRGCKFARDKAEKKYSKWVALRDVFGDCSLDRVAPFLATDAHSMPPDAVDNNGCGMMYVNVASMNKDHDFKTRNRARSLIYLFDKVLAQRRFQESGLSLCIDFKDAPFMLNRQAQSDTHHIIEALPCRLGSGFIVDAPWFFNILLSVASKFTAQKLLSRVVLRSRAEMATLVPRQHLLKQLGGALDFDPFEWLVDEYTAAGRQPPLWVLNGGPIPPPEEDDE
jgi:hypothetical protein